MKTVCEINKCNGCMVCVASCPKHCINICDSVNSINAQIDESLCIHCKQCEAVCPNINKPIKNAPIEFKQGWANSENRNNSSSGGVASAIIASFIQSGGYVASCLYKNGDFVFEITNDLEVAKKFAGSKYVKSNPTGIYEKIRARLATDKVLFVGLPCQVAALNNYIKEKDNLYTVDLICHGTPSIKLLDKFITERRYKLADVDDIKFRRKTEMGLYINGNKLYLPRVTDEYLCAFLEALDYTDNCYTCQFASLQRVADVTLGDSWGTEYREQVVRGVSLILFQTKKGRELIETSELDLKDVDIENAIANNHQLSHPSILTKKREKFLKLIQEGKSFRLATVLVLPKTAIKQVVKYIMVKLCFYKVRKRHV